jgi:hypothetical protein
MIHVKILGCKSAQRYALRRTVIAAWDAVSAEFPDRQISVTEVKSRPEIELYTQVVIYPSLVVNEKLICIGRFPHKDEVIDWLHQALKNP